MFSHLLLPLLRVPHVLQVGIPKLSVSDFRSAVRVNVERQPRLAVYLLLETADRVVGPRGRRPKQGKRKVQHKRPHEVPPPHLTTIEGGAATC